MNGTGRRPLLPPFAALPGFRRAHRDSPSAPISGRGIFLLLFAAWGLASWQRTASAMDITEAPSAQGSPPILSLRGEIVAGDFDQLAAELVAIRSRPGLPLLALDSPGGNVIEADNMANVIRRLGLGVVVSDGEECASACFLLFAASLHRAAAPGAKIGVHSASLSGDENLLTLDVTALMARAAAAFGVPPSVLGRMITTVPSDMAWLTDDELRQMNVRREGLPAPAPEQDQEPRLATGVGPLARLDEPTAPLPTLHEPELGASGDRFTLSYRAGDARNSDPPSPARQLPSPPKTTRAVWSIKPVYMANGPATSALPRYRPGN